MSIISNRNMRSSHPRVFISQNKYQYVIAFNAALVNAANIASIRRVIPNLEVSDASLSFIFTNDDFYNGYRTFAFHSNGKKTANSALNIGKASLPFTPTLGHYDPTIGKDDHIEGGDGTHTMITIKIGAGRAFSPSAPKRRRAETRRK